MGHDHTKRDENYKTILTLDPDKHYSTKELEALTDGPSYFTRNLTKMTDSYKRLDSKITPFPRTYKVTVYKGCDLIANAKKIYKQALVKDKLALARNEYKKRVAKVKAENPDDIAL